MIWEPFLLALVFGLLVSATLYFTVLWPQHEPADDDDPDDDAPAGAPAARGPQT